MGVSCIEGEVQDCFRPRCERPGPGLLKPVQGVTLYDVPAIDAVCMLHSDDSRIERPLLGTKVGLDQDNMRRLPLERLVEMFHVAV